MLLKTYLVILIFFNLLSFAICCDTSFLVASNDFKENRWSKSFTNPTKHNGSQYTYLVHTVDSWSEGAEKLLPKPELLQEAYAFSASIINQDKTGTHAGVGFIISTPFKTIKATHFQDMFSGDMFKLQPESKKELSRLVSKYKVLLPEEILLKSSHKVDSYNEVIISGTSELKIIGIVIKRGKLPMYMKPNRTQLEIVTNYAYEKQIPIIYINY